MMYIILLSIIINQLLIRSKDTFLITRFVIKKLFLMVQKRNLWLKGEGELCTYEP